MKRSITLEVAGQKLVVRPAQSSGGSDLDEAYVRRLAEFVDARVKEVAASRGGLQTHEVTLLAAINIADELVRAQGARDELRNRVRERSRALKKALDTA